MSWIDLPASCSRWMWSIRTLRATPGAEVDEHLARADDRVVELADLVALRQVGIEVVLAVEAREAVDRGLQPEPGADRLLDADIR